MLSLPATLLKYEACRIEGRPQTTQFLDYQVANSDVEAEHDHLRVGDHYVRVLTIKEAISNGQASRSQATLGSSGEFMRGYRVGADRQRCRSKGNHKAQAALQCLQIIFHFISS